MVKMIYCSYRGKKLELFDKNLIVYRHVDELNESLPHWETQNQILRRVLLALQVLS